MQIVTYEDYDSEKKVFFKRHNNAYTCTTKGTSGEYYSKTYNFDDGATWYEVMQRKTITEDVFVEKYKCKVNVDIDLFETEFFNSEDGNSKFYYEKWLVNS